VESLIHSIIIILSFGVVFIITMLVEHKVLIKQDKEGYDILETLANMTSATLYKGM